MRTPSRQGFAVSYTLSAVEGAQPNVRQESAEKPRLLQPTSHFPATTLAFLRLRPRPELGPKAQDKPLRLCVRWLILDKVY